MFERTKVAAVAVEFLGVATLTSAVLAASKSGVGFSIFVAACAGAAVTGLTLALSHVSTVNLNPAVTLGLWTTRRLTTVRTIAYLAAQFLGAYAALRLFNYVAARPLPKMADTDFSWPILVIEGAGAFLLTLIVTAAVYSLNRGTRFALTVGGAVFVGMLVASMGSNGLANPALAVGVQSWSRAYLLGPLLGGIVGANLYVYLFAPAESKTVKAKRTLVALTSAKETMVSKSEKAEKAKAAAKKSASAKRTTKK